MAGFFATTTPLTAGSTYTSPTFLADRYAEIDGTVFANQAGTLWIDQGDGTNWDESASFAITASSTNGFTQKIVSTHFRVRYVNGAAGQGTFRLRGKLRSSDLAT